MVLAVVQHKAAINTIASSPSVTLSSAPINGNLLFACIASFTGNGAMAAAAGWTRLYDDTTGTSGTMNRISAFWKYAGVGESTTQTPTSSSVNAFASAIEMWEISGVAGVWATDFREEWHALAQAASPTLATGAHNTAANYQLILGFFCGEVNWLSSNQTVGPSNTAGAQTDYDAQFNDSGSTNKPASIACERSVNSSGTNVQVTTTYHLNQEVV